MASSREKNERGRREIKAGESERSGRDRARGERREAGDFLDCPLSFKHFIVFRERREVERGKKKDRRETGAESAHRCLPSPRAAGRVWIVSPV